MNLNYYLFYIVCIYIYIYIYIWNTYLNSYLNFVFIFCIICNKLFELDSALVVSVLCKSISWRNCLFAGLGHGRNQE